MEDGSLDTVADPGDSRPVAPRSDGERLGRYILLGELGKGGMGLVYEAYDPELDRRVALKIIHANAGGEGKATARLLREAKAIARLNHPNVVGIYDVGTRGDDLFLAMELVDGQDLGRWLKKPHALGDILEVFIGAGRGLQAAHEVGLVHRDFKPANVLIGNDGRVRVLDFGLARPTEVGPVTNTAPEPALTDVLSEPVTQDGMVMGTLPYMAPELLVGRSGDARVDQYAFCVSLHEALAKRRPYKGSARDIAAAARRGLDERGPDAIPKWVYAILRRGLDPDPERRYPSMSSLLDALGRDPVQIRRKRLRIAAIAVALVVGFFGVEAARGRFGGPCAGAESRLEETWNGASAASLRASFDALAIEWGARSLDRVIEGLDAWADRWTAEYRDTCEDTHVRHEQSELVLDARMGCLEERRREFEAVLGVLHDLDPQGATRAVELVDGLQPVESCRTSARDGLDPALPDASNSEQHQMVAARLSRAEALARADRWEASRQEAAGALEEADALADPVLVARAELDLGRALRGLGRIDESGERLEKAFWSAGDGTSDRIAGEAATALVALEENGRANYNAALVWGRHAELALRRADSPLELVARLDRVIGNVYAGLGDHTAALERYRREYESMRQLHGDGHRATADALCAVGNAYDDLGDLERALDYHGRALEIIRDDLGDEHPAVALVLNNLAVTLAKSGDHEGARKNWEHALRVRRQALGEDHPETASTLLNLAIVADVQGRHDEAIALGEQALEINEKTFGPHHAEVFASLSVLGSASAAAKDWEATARYLARAVAVEGALVSGGFPPSAEVHAALASAYSSLGDNHRAREEQLRAIEFLVSDAGSDVEQVFAQLEQLADIAHAAGDREQERGDLERAIEVGEQANSPVLAQRLPLVRERLAALR